VQLLQAGKMAAMGEMAAGITHELTQPLLGIKGFATAMLEDVKPSLPTEPSVVPHIQAWKERAVRDLGVILQQTSRMATIVNNVRDFARASGTEMALLDINRPIEDALMLFSEQLRLHNIEVKKNLAPGLPGVMGNANQLQQVFINLITNARDAIDAKGNHGQLMTSTGGCNGGIYVEVKDTGIGADSETISRMFEPFFTTKNSGKSTGLGLSIVASIIEGHGGTINVEGKPGQGCKFTITLPLGTVEEANQDG
ncbi:MAG: HAMP domain-containing histidine kinase, partial [Dehalococcoidia bacterium]|nr:HAMP domain-containing histidine kinase [Dehalococcoidia bacterium]